MFDLTLFDVCAPSSSTSDDAIKGKWVRVPRDLNLQSGMWHLVRGLALPALRTNLSVVSYCTIDAPADAMYRLYQISNSSLLA